MPSNKEWLDEDVEKENEAHQKARDAEIKELKRCYRAVFNSDDGDLNIAGAAVLEDLGTLCKVNNTSFSSDALQMARNEGRREVYLWIQAALYGEVE